jgi:F-type H+-transporting ATPase subunit delta
MAELRTLGRPYARAVFQVANDSDSVSDWHQKLETLALASKDEKAALIINSVSAPASDQVNFLVGLVDEQYNSAIGKFLRVLADNKRLVLLPSIAEIFSELKAEKEKSVDVTINTAFELNVTQKEKLVLSLQNKLQRDVKVTTIIDKSLIGGVVIRAGDIVIDGSIKGRLAKLSEVVMG